MRLERIGWAEHASPAEPELRRRLEAEGFSVSLWSDRPYAHYAPHSHDHDESLWVVEGEIAFGANGAEYRLGPGDRLMLPRGTVHTADAGSEGATYLIGER
ncbi:MAG TPA: cupin domain-containing protein [Candidatus Binatia bacterium]|nr:cupin domain-containing protein [Candidatus Binatia bacterium]